MATYIKNIQNTYNEANKKYSVNSGLLLSGQNWFVSPY